MEYDDAKPRGPKPKFTLDDAIDVALDIGLNEFSLAGVAKELGFSTPSLYRVIENRDDLVDKCLERITREMRLPSADDTWQDQVRFFTDELWMLLDRYPGLSSIFLTRPFANRHAKDYIWTFCDNCQAAGYGEDRLGFSFGLMVLTEMILSSHIVVEQRRAQFEEGDQDIDPELTTPIDRVSLTRRLFFKTDEIWLDRGNLRDKVNFVIAGMEAVRRKELELDSTRELRPESFSYPGMKKPEPEAE